MTLSITIDSETFWGLAAGYFLQVIACLCLLFLNHIDEFTVFKTRKQFLKNTFIPYYWVPPIFNKIYKGFFYILRKLKQRFLELTK